MNKKTYKYVEIVYIDGSTEDIELLIPFACNLDVLRSFNALPWHIMYSSISLYAVNADQIRRLRFHNDWKE